MDSFSWFFIGFPVYKHSSSVTSICRWWWAHFNFHCPWESYCQQSIIQSCLYIIQKRLKFQMWQQQRSSWPYLFRQIWPEFFQRKEWLLASGYPGKSQRWLLSCFVISRLCPWGRLSLCIRYNFLINKFMLFKRPLGLWLVL